MDRKGISAILVLAVFVGASVPVENAEGRPQESLVASHLTAIQDALNENKGFSVSDGRVDASIPPLSLSHIVEFSTRTSGIDQPTPHKSMIYVGSITVPADVRLIISEQAYVLDFTHPGESKVFRFQTFSEDNDKVFVIEADVDEPESELTPIPPGPDSETNICQDTDAEEVAQRAVLDSDIEFVEENGDAYQDVLAAMVEDIKSIYSSQACISLTLEDTATDGGGNMYDAETASGLLSQVQSVWASSVHDSIAREFVVLVSGKILDRPGAAYQSGCCHPNELSYAVVQWSADPWRTQLILSHEIGHLNSGTHDNAVSEDSQEGYTNCPATWEYRCTILSADIVGQDRQDLEFTNKNANAIHGHAVAAS